MNPNLSNTKYEGAYSKLGKIAAGPTLFLLRRDDIPRCEEVKIVIDADNNAILTTGKNTAETKIKLQKATGE